MPGCIFLWGWGCGYNPEWKGGAPTVNGEHGVGQGASGSPQRASGKEEPSLQGERAPTIRRDPGEKIKTHEGSAPGCPARDQGKGHLHFQA